MEGDPEIQRLAAHSPCAHVDKFAELIGLKGTFSSTTPDASAPPGKRALAADRLTLIEFKTDPRRCRYRRISRWRRPRPAMTTADR